MTLSEYIEKLKEQKIRLQAQLDTVNSIVIELETINGSGS